MGTIYCLEFDDGSFYIGQTSRPINIRIQQHINTRGRGSPLLQQKWATNEYCGYTILEDNIPLEELDMSEQKWITQLNPPLNTLKGGEGLRGMNHPRSKYTEEQLMLVVKLLTQTAKSYQEIAEETGVKLGTVRDICFGRSHAWLQVPELQQARDSRAIKYRVWDRNNTEYKFINFLEFSKTHPTISPNFMRATSRSGWATQPHPILTIRNAEEEFTDTLPNIIDFLKTLGLSHYKLQRIKKGKSVTEWEVKKFTNIEY